MPRGFSNNAARPLRWRDIYREAELYKAAVRVYTKPLFLWHKALSVSTDGRTLFDFAAGGLKGLAAINEQLQSERFHFRPSVGLKYNFNGKRRTFYIPPWEERIVDLLIYRLLNQRLHRWFSPSSYAYRDHTYGLDRCQSRIRAVLRAAHSPVYVVKRDIADYFASVNHEILFQKLATHIEPDDYLFELVSERVRFDYQDESGTHRAAIGIPFGCASACIFANLYLTALDYEMDSIPNVHYFRYADDLLLLSTKRESTVPTRGNLRPEHPVSIRYINFAGQERDFSAERESLVRKKQHIVAQVAPTGRKITLSREWIQNFSEVESHLPQRIASGKDLPTGRERQILNFHKKHGSTSPRYEQLRTKYPNW